jgi:hypothetical protein
VMNFKVRSYEILCHVNRIQRVLRMVYNSQNYWVCGLCPFSGIPNTRNCSVLETGSVSILR